MNTFLKQAYDLGAQKALQDHGIDKTAAFGAAFPRTGHERFSEIPEGRGLSRAAHMLPGAAVGGALGAAVPVALSAGLRRLGLASGPDPFTGLNMLLGYGLGGLFGAGVGQAHSQEGDPAIHKLKRELRSLYRIPMHAYKRKGLEGIPEALEVAYRDRIWNP